MYNEVITFVEVKNITDDYGDSKKTRIERDVFCRVKSIGQSEFYQASTNGLKPEIKFVLADYYDYEGESEVIYGSSTYKVLRTYRQGVELEITCYGGVERVSTEECNQSK